MTVDPLVGITLGQRYHVDARLAGGGMATVYIAHDQRLDRRVALKVMHANLTSDPAFVRRFIGEAQAVAKLSHANVVQVFDQGTDQGYVYLAMEYVPGSTLRDLLHTHGRLPPEEALRTLASVLAGLGAAHRAGLVHRDIKPENVLLTADGQVKVADFGLARAAEGSVDGQTRAGELLGTAAYLAPEQITDNRADARTDVYAAGIVLYELLTGEQPHTGESPIAVAYQHVNTDVPPPSRRVAELPEGVDQVVASATARDPERRPSDAQQLLAQLQSAVPDIGAPAPVAAATSVLPAAAAGHHNATLVDGLATQNLTDPGSTSARGGRWQLVVGALIVLAVLGVLAGYAWWLLVGRYEPVPDLVGMTEDEAVATAEDAGIDVVVGDEPVYSDDVAEGEVAETSPEAGASILPDEDTVTLSLSQGGRHVELPEGLVGRPAGEVRAELEELGFTEFEEEETVSYDQPMDVVVGISPSEGSAADREEPIELRVSAGFDAPDLVGEHVDDARTQLEDAGLEADIVEEENEDIPEDEVMEQAPAAGESVAHGDTVTLTVSAGPPDVEVPDLHGMPLDEAQAELEELGLEVTVRGILGDRVRAMSPEPGESVPPGTEIELNVSPLGLPGRGGDGPEDDD
ncbi:Stk1 family PASTA domain-containing Ser/Thr kinase [Lipingzhangella sp. LS1_29]|uniref:non-specific serine/threonine protein kinase n=1 Tax=Lipingzhangella rawalii TaxID=2055835 RepID=A0ABU2H082_9ACTN|nr:Stk1 family PASTA domain-containing Ser/Thr kinase [Lipingzhangella rawalii]MDS1268724.1 Stk1 family PASTA domain-containing Ser/Thr kinase [Lipingzhangella rawalii]